MTVQTLKIGNREFVLLAKRDFVKLAAKAEKQQAEEDYWTKSALDAESKSRESGERPIPFEEVERELDARKRTGKRPASTGRARR